MSSIQFLITITAPIVSGAASAVGDPYIKPMEGELFKLPNRVANYRVFEGPDFVMNAEVDRFDERSINASAAKMNSQMFGGSLQVADQWKDMYFFRRVWINGHVFNLETMTWDGEPFPGASQLIEGFYVDGGDLYANEKMFSVEIPLPGNRGKVILGRFPNPQVRSGITAYVTEPEEWDGLIRREYQSKSVQLKKLADTRKVVFQAARPTQGTVKKEVFTTRDNATGVFHKVTREIRVI